MLLLLLVLMLLFNVGVSRARELVHLAGSVGDPLMGDPLVGDPLEGDPYHTCDGSWIKISGHHALQLSMCRRCALRCLSAGVCLVPALYRREQTPQQADVLSLLVFFRLVFL